MQSIRFRSAAYVASLIDNDGLSDPGKGSLGLIASTQAPTVGNMSKFAPFIDRYRGLKSLSTTSITVSFFSVSCLSAFSIAGLI